MTTSIARPRSTSRRSRTGSITSRSHSARRTKRRTLLAGMAAVLAGPRAHARRDGAGVRRGDGLAFALPDAAWLPVDSARRVARRRSRSRAQPMRACRSSANAPAPRFLVFDGQSHRSSGWKRRSHLCFHAFHHVPNPAAMVRELAACSRQAASRVRGARAATFRSSFSQFEMQTYKVVENDVDVHRIWHVAKASGFSDMRLAVFHGSPFHVSLQEFEELLAGGRAAGAWTAATRVFLRSMRTFFLVKAGEPRVDSRTTGALACTLHATLATATPTWVSPSPWTSPLRIRGGRLASVGHRDGRRPRRRASLRRGGPYCNSIFRPNPLTDPPHAIEPRASVRLRVSLSSRVPGRYVVEIRLRVGGDLMVRTAWFEGVQAVEVVDVTRP